MVNYSFHLLPCFDVEMRENASYTLGNSDWVMRSGWILKVYLTDLVDILEVGYKKGWESKITPRF